MNIQMMHEATRISDRFIGRGSLDSIDRQGRLVSVTAMVVIFHLISGIALIKMDEFRDKRTRFIPSLDIAFETNVLLKAVPPQVAAPMRMPQPAAMTDGHANRPGGMMADKLAAEKLTVPVPVAAENHELIAARAAASSNQSRKMDVRPVDALKKTTLDSAVVASQTQVEGNQPGVDSTRAESGAPSKSGSSVEGSEFGKDDGIVGHNGAGGLASIPGTEGDGSEQGFAGGVLPAVAVEPPPQPKPRGRNIAPYRDNLVALLAKNWKVRGKVDGLALYILLNNSGEVVESRILRSSGKKGVDQSALEAVRETRFEPLPDWYKGDTLPFQIEMQKR